MKLGQKVEYIEGWNGIVGGRTFEADPKLDILTPLGRLNSVRSSELPFSGLTELLDGLKSAA